MIVERPEHELLLLCIRRPVGLTDDRRLADILARPLDWPYVMRLAARHQLVPLLYACLRPGVAAAPPPIVETLRHSLHVIHAWNRRAGRELVRLNHRARDAGIRMMSFKGPVLAKTLYGDVGARQFHDLDVLVHPADVGRIERCFGELGYRRKIDHGYEVTLISGDAGLPVDLHHALTPSNFPVVVDFDALWRRRITVSLDDGDVTTFCVGDLAIALCIDAVKDAWAGKLKLAKLAGLARLCESLGETDWALVAQEARQLGVEQIVCFAVRLTADVLDLPSPEPPGIVARPRRWARFLQEAEEALFVPARLRPPATRRGNPFHFRIRERWRDKLRPYVNFAHGLVRPTAVDRDVVSLPPWLAVLYYLVRPVRLARKYGARLIRA